MYTNSVCCARQMWPQDNVQKTTLNDVRTVILKKNKKQFSFILLLLIIMCKISIFYLESCMRGSDQHRICMMMKNVKMVL